ncbi:MAG: hypothetical protein AUJ47_11560 [Candidatus Marinimicrobia bacterium CG1_02_48_14]|nr:MAG: hypothetical protein AUJ47_11560 [Candidatus Marinimicrobia bacterium CG1_02_48_14]
MKRLFTNTGLLLLFPLMLAAQSMVGTKAAPFLGIEVGGRSLGMGGANVASVNDATALYWNPGAAASLMGSEVLFVHTGYLADTRFDYVAGVFQMPGFGVIGISTTVLDYGNMLHTTVEKPEGDGLTFTATDLAVGVTLARAMTDRFFIGGTMKYIQQRIWHEQASAMALDLGTLYRTGFRGLTIGMSISNFGSPLQLVGHDLDHFYDIAPDLKGNNSKIVSSLKTDPFNLPILFRAGLVMDIFNQGPLQLKIAIDALHPNYNNESVNIGSELLLFNQLAIRAGYKSLFLEDSEEGLTLGAGLNVPLTGVRLRADYGYQIFGRLTEIQNFSVALVF